jgi:hypothetical protein
MTTPIINVDDSNGDLSVDATIGQGAIDESHSTQPSTSKQKFKQPDSLTPLTPDQDGISSSSLPPPLNLDESYSDLVHSSPNNSPLHSPDLPPTEPSFWNKVLILLFPSLEGFSQKSFIAKLIALMVIPTNLVLTLTLPVIESDEIDSNNIEKKQTENPLQAPSIVIEDDPELVVVEAPDEERKEIKWNRWLTAAQFVFAPLFVSSVLFCKYYYYYFFRMAIKKNVNNNFINFYLDEDDSSDKIILYSFLGGVVISMLWISFTYNDKPPRFYSSLCYIGFGVAIVWIYLIANEVVGLLQVCELIRYLFLKYSEYKESLLLIL